MVSSNPFHPEYEPETVDTVKVHHISSTRPKANKVYSCSCCGQLIAKGEKHYKNIFKLGKDKKIRTERAHINCPGW